MIIKVCGMREPDNIRAIESLGVDWLGFIFYPKSPRYVQEPPSYMPRQAKRVGVFVNATAEFIMQHVAEYKLDFIQLHGKETPGFCQALRELLQAGFAQTLIIKAFSIAEENDLQLAYEYEGTCDYYLFDTKCDTYGGSGKTFEWKLLQRYYGQTPFLLSGGIGPESLQSLNIFRHPQWKGIDLNSCFETAPAVKNISQLEHFLANKKKFI